MSWWSSLFSFPTPHDAKTPTRITQHEPRILEEPIADSQLSTRATAAESAVAARPNRNRVVFGAGLAFFTFSLLITRRSFTRRRLASKAAFYTNAPNHHVEQSAKVNGAMEAVEALNIATVNVLSLAMMGIGGTLWYYDIESMDDARRMMRGGLGVDGTGRTEKEAEEDFEEWLATTLSRKEAKAAKQQTLSERNL